MAQCTEQEVQRLLPLVPAFRREYALRYHHTFGRFCTLQSWLMLEDLFQQCAFGAQQSAQQNNNGVSQQQCAFGTQQSAQQNNNGVSQQQCAPICHLQPATCNLHYGQYGKPYLPSFPEFSISHCKTAIAVAVNEEPIGIDVESIRHADDALLAHTMNKKEIEQIRQADVPDRMFTQLWTQKEAYLKCLGTGITDDLPHVLEHADPTHFIIINKEHYIVTIYQS